MFPNPKQTWLVPRSASFNAKNLTSELKWIK